MATPTTGGSYTYVADSGTQSIDALLVGFKWGGGVGTGTTVTFSFPTYDSSWYAPFYSGWEPNAPGYGEIGYLAQQGVVNALQAWSDVANISFQQVADNADTVGDIRVAETDGGEMDPFTGAYTWVAPGGGDIGGAPQVGDIWVNSVPPVYTGYFTWEGKYGYHVLNHELGHAIGLDHPFNPYDPTDPDTGLTVAQNTYKYTVMAYCDAPGEWDTGFASFYPTTPMLLDIAALQHLYGANTTYHAGNDTYTFSEGSNYYQTIWDAGGIDTFVYNGTAGGKIDLREGLFSQVGNAIELSNGALQYDTVAIAYDVVIENALGGNGNDSLYGNGAANTLNGRGGADYMAGGLGDDWYYVDNAGDAVFENAGQGTDIVRSYISYSLGNNVENLALLGTANVNAVGNALDNVITGNAGNNVINAGAGADTLAGGAGNDNYVVDNAGDTVTENVGEGTDIVRAAISYALTDNVENLTLLGTGNIDATGNALGNAVTGNSGNNVIDGGVSADAMAGGLGNDTYVVDNSGDTVTEGAAAGTDTVQASASFALGANVENLTLTGGADLYGIGNTLNNAITGNGGNNILNGGVGADTMIGGLGDDNYVVDNAGDVVTENAAEGTDLVRSFISYSLGDNLENLTLLGTANLNAAGNALDNVITGNGGNNVINAGAGADTMAGGAGNDNYVVDDVGDTVTEAASAGTDIVRAAISYTLGANLENLTLLGTGNIDATGNGLNNALTGNSGNNVIDGGAGTDAMAGGLGNDTYVVDNSGDTVTEGAAAGTDTVQSSVTYALGNNLENLTLTGAAHINGIGNALDNVITGNAGNNVINAGAGADTMAGGAGNDNYVVDNAGDVVTENAGEGTDIVRAAISYTLTDNVENLTLLGTGNLNATGNGLNNAITGTSGNNVIDGGAGADAMAGGLGDDSYVVDNAGDVVTEAASAGIDAVQASVSHILGANIENLTLTGAANIYGLGNSLNNTITGNAGDNILNGGVGADTMIGGLGDDNYVVDDAGDTIVENLGEGTDLVRSFVSCSLGANVENLTLLGTDNINAAGNALDNVITGNGGNNVINAGAGADTMAGGAGNDNYVVDDAGDTVTENAGEGTDIVRAAISYTLTDNVENLTLLGTGNINATGNGLNNAITGTSGNNVIDGGAGADAMAGGLGDDSYVVDNAGDVVTEAASAGIDAVQASVSHILGANIENLTLTGAANIYGLGNSLNNTITGNAGDNILNGGVGADTMIGGLGDDNYVVDDAGDTIVENLGEGTDLVRSFVSCSLGANVENLTLLGTDNINAAGNALDNVITGNGGNNVINAGAGADTMAGGAGNDNYVVDNAGDVVTENADEGIDIVRAAISYTLTDNVENLTLLGTGNLNATGNGLNNVLTGNAGNNTIDGGLGSDVLTGGSGADIFQFSSALDSLTNVDSVLDFSLTEDVLQLSQSIFTVLGAGALNASELCSGAGVTAGQGTSHLAFDTTTGNLYYDADASGAGDSVLFAQLTAGLGLSDSDFFVV